MNVTSPYAAIQDAIKLVKGEQETHDSREYAVTLTKLEEAEMWLLRAQECLRQRVKMQNVNASPE